MKSICSVVLGCNYLNMSHFPSIFKVDFNMFFCITTPLQHHYITRTIYHGRFLGWKVSKGVTSKHVETYFLLLETNVISCSIFFWPGKQGLTWHSNGRTSTCSTDLEKLRQYYNEQEFA